MSTKMTVMTFNLRTEAKVDGINNLPNRLGRITETIDTYKPDLIGFQEARDGMRDWLFGNLSEYIVVGCGRQADYRGESVPLAFRKDKFMMINSENFWLSSTPLVAGSTYEGSDQSRCPRMCTTATLKHLESDTPILFVNTHTDHQGEMARTLETAQIMQYVSEKDLPTVVTGDFNAFPDSMEIKLMTASEGCPMTDATSHLGGTYHGYGEVDPPKKIDYVFTNMPVDREGSFVVDDGPIDGIYISDHCPVMATVELD